MASPIIRKVADAAESWLRKSWPLAGHLEVDPEDQRPIKQHQASGEFETVGVAHLLGHDEIGRADMGGARQLPPEADDPEVYRRLFRVEVEDW